MELVIIILSKIIQTQKERFHIMSYVPASIESLDMHV